MPALFDGKPELSGKLGWWSQVHTSAYLFASVLFPTSPSPHAGGPCRREIALFQRLQFTGN